MCISVTACVLQRYPAVGKSTISVTQGCEHPKNCARGESRKSTFRLPAWQKYDGAGFQIYSRIRLSLDDFSEFFYIMCYGVVSAQQTLTSTGDAQVLLYCPINKN